MKEITKEKFIEGIKKMVEDGVARNESEAMYMFYTQRGNAYKIDGKTIEQLGNDGTLDEWMFGNNTKEDMNEINSSEPTPTPEPMPEKSEEEDLRISGSNKTRFQDIVKKYNDIYKQAQKFVDVNDNGKGLSGDAKEEYKERLNGYVSQLKEIEQSDEVKQLMYDVYTDGLNSWSLGSNDRYIFGSLAEGKLSKLIGDSKSGDWSWLGKSGIVNQDPKTAAERFIARDMKVKGKNNQEEKTKQEESKHSFGADVASKYGENANEYVNKRDENFAKYLVGKNITSEKKVRELLSKYDSFNSASEDNKERTVKRIMDKISEKVKKSTDGRIEEGDDPYVNDMLGKEIKSNAKPKEETKNTENGAYKGYYSDQQSKAPKEKEKEKSKSGDVFGGILDNLGMGARNYVDNILKRNKNK